MFGQRALGQKAIKNIKELDQMFAKFDERRKQMEFEEQTLKYSRRMHPRLMKV